MINNRIINKIKWRRAIYPLATLSSSFLGMLGLVKASTFNTDTPEAPILIILISRVGVGFVQCWSSFFISEISFKKNKNNSIIILIPSIFITIPLCIYNINLGIAFFVGAIQATYFQSLIFRNYGKYTILWGVFLNSIVLLVLSIPSEYVVNNWSYIYIIIYFVGFIIYRQIIICLKVIPYNEIKLDKVIADIINKNIAFKNQLTILNYNFISKIKSSDIPSRIYIAFLTCILFSISTLIIPILCPTELLPFYIFVEKISTSFSSSMNSRFMVIGFFELNRYNMIPSRVITFTILTSIFVLTFLFSVENIAVFPFTIKNLQDVLKISLDEESITNRTLDVLVPIIIISFACSLSVNTGYALRALQLNTQSKLLTFNYKNKKTTQRYIFITFLFILSILFLISNNINLNNIYNLNEFNLSYFYIIKPSLLFLLWWILVSIWSATTAHFILRKDSEKNI